MHWKFPNNCSSFWRLYSQVLKVQISVDTGQGYFARVPHQKIIHFILLFFFFGGLFIDDHSLLKRAKTLISLFFDQDLLFYDKKLYSLSNWNQRVIYSFSWYIQRTLPHWLKGGKPISQTFYKTIYTVSSCHSLPAMQCEHAQSSYPLLTQLFILLIQPLNPSSGTPSFEPTSKLGLELSF